MDRSHRCYDNLLHLSLSTSRNNRVSSVSSSTSKSSRHLERISTYALCKLAKSRSSNNHTLSVALVRSCWCLSALTTPAIDAYDSLQVKQIQVVTMSHLVVKCLRDKGYAKEIV